MMRILLLSSLYPNRVQPGKGQFVRERMRQMQRRYDFEWRVVAPVPWFPFPHPAFGAYSEFARVPAEEQVDGERILHPRYPVVPRVGDLFTPLGYANAVARCIRERGLQFDLIDAHFFFPDGVAATLLGRKLGKPVVVTARGSDINAMPDEAVAGQWIRWAARRSTELVAVAPHLADRLSSLSHGRHVLVAPNGVDTDRFSPRPARSELRARLGLHGKTVLTVGNLIELKGHHLVLDAVRALPAVTLLIAGEGPWRHRLQALVDEHGLHDRVRLLGAVPQQDLVDYYSAVDMLVLASSSEGSPNVVLEALACGTPVITTVAQAVPAGASAEDVVVIERSPAAISQAIQMQPESSDHRAGIRERALGLDWSATCATLNDLYGAFQPARRAAAA